MKHHLISMATILAALICYLSGSNDGAFALIMISLALESTFWFRVHSRSRPATLDAASLNVTLDGAFSCYSLLTLMFVFWGGWLWFAGSAVVHDPDPIASHLPAMLKMSGGEMVMFASAVTVLLLVPFRQGAVWARWAIPALLFVQFGVLYALRSNPLPMPTSEFAARLGAGAAITMVALALSLITTKKLAPS